MGYSVIMLVLECLLPCLGLGLFCYLFKLCLENKFGHCKKTAPHYVTEINKRLYLHNVETERDLL